MQASPVPSLQMMPQCYPTPAQAAEMRRSQDPTSKSSRASRLLPDEPAASGDLAAGVMAADPADADWSPDNAPAPKPASRRRSKALSVVSRQLQVPGLGATAHT